MKTENCNIPSEIDIYEDLGTRVILTVRIGDHNLMIETLQGFKAEMGQKVWLGFDASRIVLFDKKSGESIL
jgi:ABC-type sugar transport system ATPase subunit